MPVFQPKSTFNGTICWNKTYSQRRTNLGCFVLANVCGSCGTSQSTEIQRETMWECCFVHAIFMSTDGDMPLSVALTDAERMREISSAHKSITQITTKTKITMLRLISCVQRCCVWHCLCCGLIALVVDRVSTC